MRRWFLAFLLLAAVAAAGKGKEPLGQVLDRDRLLKVLYFCIDTSQLDDAEAREVSNFVESERKPRRLLSRLPWGFSVACSEADAVIALNFDQRMGGKPAPIDPPLPGGPMTNIPEPEFQVTLVVRERSSGKPLYQVQGARVRTRRERALISPFTILGKDLKTLSPPGGK